jgi:hypothetical protein
MKIQNLAVILLSLMLVQPGHSMEKSGSDDREDFEFTGANITSLVSSDEDTDQPRDELTQILMHRLTELNKEPDEQPAAVEQQVTAAFQAVEGTETAIDNESRNPLVVPIEPQYLVMGTGTYMYHMTELLRGDPSLTDNELVNKHRCHPAFVKEFRSMRGQKKS